MATFQLPSLLQTVTMQSAATATGNGTAAVTTSGNAGAFATLTMQVSGISGDTITFEATADDTNWVSVLVTNLTSGTAATTTTADGIFQIAVGAISQVRARISTYSAGTITVAGRMVS